MPPTPLRAIMVCVDFADLLAITLTFNRYHFGQVMVVTAPHDKDTVTVANQYDNVGLHVTNAFYRNGARFNKWLALEEGLDAFGRNGWLCIMDVDIAWPERASLNLDRYLRPGFLYSPLRRMMPMSEVIRRYQSSPLRPSQVVPPEAMWCDYLIHRNIHEWAGYTQIFHADDPVLGQPPWHQTDWTHAGGADSFFQAKWPNESKVRPNWEVLHLGDAGENWMGRTSARLDGTIPAEAESRRDQLNLIWQQRRTNAQEGLDRFEGERLSR